MSPRLLTGAPVSEAVFADLTPRIEALIAQGHRPRLGTILVGGRLRPDAELGPQRLGYGPG